MSSDRIFQQDRQWYFRVRGHAIKGPYRNYADAERGLTRYVAARRPPARARVLGWLRTHRARTPARALHPGAG
jgi:hypothetical protein